MYDVGPYYLTKTLIDFPIIISVPMIFSIVVYFGVGLTVTAGQFFYFYFVLFMLAFTASSFGYFISSIFNQEETAV